MRQKSFIHFIALLLALCCMLTACSSSQPVASHSTTVELPMPTSAPIRPAIQLVNPIDPIQQVLPSTMDKGGATPAPTVDPLIEMKKNADEAFMKNRVNVLLLGLDRSAERENWGSFRTDTMILVTVDFDTNRVDMISIPRDSYVKIYNKPEGRYKINSAFSSGGGASKKGYEYATKTVGMLFGNLPIDYYLGFDMQVVKDVVNAMGGVDYDVDVPIKMNGRELQVGMQHLDGQAVLDYARQRKGSSDIARVDRQQRIMLAVFDQLKSTNQLFNIPKIFMAVQKNIDTNLGVGQITALGLLAATMDRENIHRHTVPGEFLNIDNISYWGISQNKLKALVKEVFAKTISIDPEGDVYEIKKELEQKALQMQGLRTQALEIAQKAQAMIDEAALSPGRLGTLSNIINAIDTGLETQNEGLLLGAIKLYHELDDGIVSNASTSDQPRPDPEPSADEIPDETDETDETDEMQRPEDDTVILE